MSCPNNPPSPEGFRIWRGAVPPQLTDWAIYLRDLEAPQAPYGTVWGMNYTPSGGSPIYVLARKDHHSWTFRGGRLVTGICIFGITLFSQIPTAAQTSFDSLTDTLDAPDPNAAVYTSDVPSPSPSPSQPDWGLVAASGAAGVGVVLLFWLGLRAFEKPKKLRS